MSCILSTNSGPLESMNFSEGCGRRPKAFRTRRIVVCERPTSAAIDQWVSSFGVVFKVRPEFQRSGHLIRFEGVPRDTRRSVPQSQHEQTVAEIRELYANEHREVQQLACFGVLRHTKRNPARIRERAPHRGGEPEPRESVDPRSSKRPPLPAHPPSSVRPLRRTIYFSSK